MTTEHSGSGNVQRSLQLLWGQGERPTRGPKPGLTLDRIVHAAIETADAEGIGAVSMRRIATELGVGTMSLYRYVPGKAELLDLMTDAVCVVPGPSPVEGWRAVLEEVARGIWDQYRAHPWLHNVNQSRPVLGPNSLAGMEVAVSGLSGLPLTDQQKITVIMMIDSFVTGTARTQELAAQAARVSGISDEDFWATQGPVLSDAMHSGRYPAMAQLSAGTFDVSGDEAFEFGLERLLDGVQRFLETADGGPANPSPRTGSCADPPVRTPSCGGHAEEGTPAAES